MSARTALFLCPSNFSIGELHNAMMAGRDLLANGWGVRYMVSRRNLDYARSSGADAELLSESEKDAAAVLEHVRSLAPDLLLLADHHIWALEPTAVSIGELLELGIPTVAADSLCLGPRARTLDLAIAHLQGAESIRHWFPPTVELPPLPKGLPVIRGRCPRAPRSRSASSSGSSRGGAWSCSHDPRGRRPPTRNSPADDRAAAIARSALPRPTTSI